ncbi:MAG: SAM-dependent chlorinase/fluorinase [Candidatus Thermoplasmatota archaeon]|nr:SAM-dependent chlorinase/fluorinase [Candidatus Thermoplasmatota archaeon]
MQQKIMTFLTDFGSASSYPAQMKAIALSLTDSYIIDITHNIQPHNILEGAFILKNTAPLFPKGTIHIAVVDPGVGTNRRALIVTTQSQIFIGPDNGLLIPAAQLIGDMHVFTITNEKYMRLPRSITFDGRDVFTPVAAHILNGIPFTEFGSPITDFLNLEFPTAQRHENELQGEILFIDRFGNAITNIERRLLLYPPNEGTQITLELPSKTIQLPFVPAYGYVKKHQLLATVGSSDVVEIAMNQGNAAEKLKLHQSMPIRLIFH